VGTERIGQENRAELEAFRCATADSVPSQEMERAIRKHMANQLQVGGIEGRGFREPGGELSAVIFFTPSPSIWRIHILATDVRFRHRKRALRLKRDLATEATGSGASALSSVVDATNGPMLALNRKLSAICEPRADDFIVCTIPLRRQPTPGPASST
jgi:hypothetical protein